MRSGDPHSTNDSVPASGRPRSRRRHAINHGISGTISGVLAAKLFASKTLFVGDAVLGTKFGIILFDQLLYQIPHAAFTYFGNLISQTTGLEIDPLKLGIILGYPLLFVLVNALISGIHVRRLFSYWLGSTAITIIAVLISRDAHEPSPKLETLSVILAGFIGFLRQVIDVAGGWLAQFLGQIPGLEPDPAIGIVIFILLLSVVYGILWDKAVGHESRRES